MIADFTWPVVQSGWLELDGSDISTSTYSGLYGVMTIQTTGTRTNASPVITSIASTATFKVGYYVFGTGFASGTTIISIDSATQITVSNNAASSGTAALAVSPWFLNTGTIRLPDVSTAGRYRRSRTSTTAVGQLQADQNQAHTHSLTVSGTTSTIGDHSHPNVLNDPTHTHVIGGGSVGSVKLISNLTSGGAVNSIQFNNGTDGSVAISAASTNITISNGAGGSHAHTVTSTGTSGSTGSAEARPLSIVVMTCVKT